MRFFARLGLPAVVVLALTGCGRPAAGPAAGPAGALTHVSFQTDWLAEPDHGGFYQALVKGYYREAGLDVEIRQGGPGAAPKTKVALGRADFGMGRSDEVIVAASRGIPLVMIGAFMQRDPQAIMFHRESGIHSFSDLDGRNIMAVPGLPFLPIVEKKFHIKVSITPSDFGIGRFLADRNFIQQCFVTDEPYYAEKHGANVGVLLLSDSGFSPYRVWYTSRNFIEKHPDLVRAFSQASIRGWRDYIDGDRTAADARIASLNPQMDADIIAYDVQAMRTYRLVADGAGEVVGQILPERIADQIKQLTEIGLLDRPVSVDDVFDRRFQP
jgi:NitT/TauT family transport system substrate-binding protein